MVTQGFRAYTYGIDPKWSVTHLGFVIRRNDGKENETLHGRWNLQEARLHINKLELKAALLRI